MPDRLREPAHGPDATLEPRLTKFDKRVLKILDPWPEGPDRFKHKPTGLTVWQIAEVLREDDVRMVRQVLAGLAHCGYASQTGYRTARKPERWTRDISGKANTALGIGGGA